MKIILIDNCLDCPHCTARHCERLLKKVPIVGILDECTLPDIHHAFGDLYHSNKLTKAIAQESLDSGARFDE